MIEDPQEQFHAMWENLRIVLEAANCTFDDVVEVTSYHVEMSKHMDIPYGEKRSVSRRNLRFDPHRRVRTRTSRLACRGEMRCGDTLADKPTHISEPSTRC